MKDTEQTRQIRTRYSAYKIADLAVQLYRHGVPADDLTYILQGGETIPERPYPALQSFLAGAMNRMEERIPHDRAVVIRQDSACCLTGVRNTLARKICRENPTVETRWEAFAKERKIIYGSAWTENGDYFISYWYARPAAGYTCGCLRCVPETPMNPLWCECCAGHIRHHFETALGVRATCRCVRSVLSSCGEEACLFRLHITEILP